MVSGTLTKIPFEIEKLKERKVEWLIEEPKRHFPTYKLLRLAFSEEPGPDFHE